MGRVVSKIADYLRECDKVLLILCLAASCYGSVAVLSATHVSSGAGEFITQIVAMLIGLAFAVFISLFDYKRLARYWFLIAAGSVIPVILTFFIGYAPGNTDDKAWLRIGGMSFQPSEILKIAFAITFALHISIVGNQINKIKNVFLLCLHAAVPVGLIFLQGDFGSALIFCIMFLGMMFVAGLKVWYWVTAGAAAIIAAPLAYFFVLNDDHRERIIQMFDINSDLLGAGWQQWRGRIALANGGFFGQGLFRGTLTQIKDGVPEGHNDFIFVCIGEELGMLGCIAVLLLLAAILVRIINISKNTNDTFGKFICIGIFSMLAGQIIINIGMCVSILPVIGVTLPFFSAGGTSLMATFISIGVVLNVYMHRSSLKLRLNDI